MAVFFYLAYSSWRNAKETIRHFALRNLEDLDDESNSFKIIREFVAEFNEYLDKVNTSNTMQNQVTAGVFFFAGLAALISFVLSMFGVIQ
jgi:hypothetical protein